VQDDLLDYDALLARCMGRRDLAERLLDKFLTNLDDDLSRIKQFLQDEVWDEAAKTAHKVKGAAASLEATQLRACLEQLERALREDQPVDPDAVSKELDRTSHGFRLAAASILGDRSGDGRSR
jgi:HPt (histidine-containing phosphotransfer) domain-containing protein